MRVALGLVTLLGSSLAFAQPDPQPAPTEEQPPAVKLFVEGREALDRGDAGVACQKFEQSFKLDASAAGTMLNLGLCNEQLGKLATALKWFRRAHARAAENQLTETEALAKDKSTQLAARVGVLRLVVSGPTGKSPAVTLDGVPVPDVDYGRIEVDAAHHVLEATAAGAPTVHRELDSVDGKTETVELRVVIPPLPKSYEVVDLGRSQRRRAYLAGATGATLLAGAGVIAFVGKRENDRAELPDDFHSSKDLVRYGATPLFLVGSAALVYSVVLYVKAPGKERREVITPVIGADRVGIGFAKQF